MTVMTDFVTLLQHIRNDPVAALIRRESQDRHGIIPRKSPG
jgi:hypothetical protein